MIPKSPTDEYITTKNFERLSQKRWAVRNVYGVSISMVMVFTAFVGLQNLQSSINSSDGLGLISLSVLYGVFVVIGPFTPIILRRFGTKYSLLIGFVCHLVYTLANFFPSWYTLIPGSILIGLASGPIWAAAGSHLAEIAITTAVTLDKDQSYLISKYTAVFFFVFQFSQLPGNIASSLILFPYTTTNSSNYTSALGSPLVSFAAQVSPTSNNTDLCTYLDGAIFEQTYLFYILVSIYCIFILAGIAILLLTVDRIKMLRYYAAESKEDSSWLRMYLKLPLLEILSVLKSWKMVMLAPMALFTGMEMGFAFGTFTRVYISECLGTHQVGLALMTLGACSGLMSFVCSKLIKYIPRFAIILTGAAIHLAIFLLLALWEREPSYYVVYIGAVLWGCGNAIWNTIGTSLAGILFPQRLESAYSVVRIWLALGFTLSYVLANFMAVMVRAWIVIFILLLSVICLLVIEVVVKEPCRKQSSVKDEMLSSESSRSTASNKPSYGSALFEACGGIVLSDISLSWVYQVDGSSEEGSSSSSSSSDNSSSNNEVSEHSSPHCTLTVKPAPKPKNKQSGKPLAKHRAPSPAYSHKSEIFERHSSLRSSVTTCNSVPTFSQYNGATLSAISTSFVNTVIQTNRTKPQESPQVEENDSETSDSSNTLFKLYTGDGLTNMSSTFIHATENDGTLSEISSGSVFKEYQNESLINLSTFLVASNDQEDNQAERESQLVNNYTCDSIDGTQPQLNTYSFSHYLHTIRSRNTNPPAQDHSHSSQTRATSAPADPYRRYRMPLLSESTTCTTTSVTCEDKTVNKSTDNTEVDKSGSLSSKHSEPTTCSTNHEQSQVAAESTGSMERDSRSRSDIIYVGPRQEQDSDSEEESMWTSVSLSRHSV